MSDETQTKSGLDARTTWTNDAVHLDYDSRVRTGENPCLHPLYKAAEQLDKTDQLGEYLQAQNDKQFDETFNLTDDDRITFRQERHAYANAKVGERVQITGLDASSPPGSKWALGKFAKIIGVKVVPAFNAAAAYEGGDVATEDLPLFQQSHLPVLLCKVLIEDAGPFPRYYHFKSLKLNGDATPE